MLPRPTGRYDLVPRLKHSDYLVKATSQNTMLGLVCTNVFSSNTGYDRRHKLFLSDLTSFVVFYRGIGNGSAGLLDHGSDGTVL